MVSIFVECLRLPDASKVDDHHYNCHEMLELCRQVDDIVRVLVNEPS